MFNGLKEAWKYHRTARDNSCEPESFLRRQWLNVVLWVGCFIVMVGLMIEGEDD